MSGAKVDLVLSDVHLGVPATDVQCSGVESRFVLHDALPMAQRPNKRLKYDDDGDVELHRGDVLSITHSMATPIADVGLQIWRGALLLCDFVLHFASIFAGAGMLELGSGPGLVAVVLAKYANPGHLLLTDAFDSVLELAVRTHLFRK